MDRLTSDRASRALAVAAIGLSLAIFGTAVMALWLLAPALLVRLVPGTPVAFATGAAFALAGGALALEASAAALRARARALAALLLLGLGIAALVEAAGVKLGVNAGGGGMAEATAIAFMLCAVALLALERHPGAARTPLAAVALIGSGALVGNLLNLGALFPGYTPMQVAYPTAAAFVLLALGLWRAAAARAGYASLWSDDGARIRAWTSIIVVGAVIIAALAGFALMQRTAERMLGAALADDLESQLALIGRELAQRRLAAEALALRPDLQRALRAAATRPEALVDLRRHISSQLEFEFIALAVYDAHGREIAFVGAPPREPLMRLTLDGDAALAWRAGVELESRIAVVDRGERLGMLELRQPLAEMTPRLAEGEVLTLCALETGLVRCLPSPGTPRPPARPLAQATPQMAAALAGGRGVRRGSDFRGVDVIAAYAPLKALGLGAILRMDTARVFAGLRGELASLALLVLVLAGISIALLRWQLLPLVRRLARSEDRLRRALEGSRLALWELDVPSGIVHLSPQWNAMRGGEAREDRTTLAALTALVAPEEAALVGEHLRRALRGEITHYDVEHRVAALDGRWIWIRSRGEIDARGPGGRALRMIGTNALITERKEKELAAVREATHDALTGLANRRLFADRLGQALARARRSGAGLALLYLDMDRLKPVNDTHGHGVGDALLKAFAARLSACVRSSDTVARLGGDEFALVLEGLASALQAEALAAKIVAAMHAPFDVAGRDLQVSASIGVAVVPGGTLADPDELVHAADTALYEAKRAGRDRYALAGTASVASSASSAAGS